MATADAYSESFPTDRRQFERRQGERRLGWPDPLDEPPEVRMERKIDAISFAVFGNPMDKEDHGITGEIRTVQHLVASKLDRLFHTVLGLAGVLIIVAVTVALAVK